MREHSTHRTTTKSLFLWYAKNLETPVTLGENDWSGEIFCKPGYFSSRSSHTFTEEGLFWEMGFLERKSLILG